MANNTAQLKSIMPGVQVRDGKRGKTIRFFCMVGGERFTKTCDLPIGLLINEKGGPTRDLKAEYGRWVSECAGKSGRKTGKGLRIPSIRELIDLYEKIAWKRNADPAYNKPSERSIETAVKNYRYCVEASGLRETRPYTELMDPDMIRKIFRHHAGRKTSAGKTISGQTAWSYVASLQSVTADWTIIEYRDNGFEVKQPIMPDFGKAKEASSYRELPKELIEKIWNWYMVLVNNDVPDCTFYATMMLELAMRPSDIAEITADNFPLDANGHHRLVYQPRKTKESSNRRVDIEIPDPLFEKLHALVAARWDAGDKLLPNAKYVEVQVNTSMRMICGMKVEDYPKASYELRKLCIHTILNTPVEDGGGIDQAVRLSGDRRDTIEKYYCDPYKSHTALPNRPLEALLEKIGAHAVERTNG